MLKDCLIVVNTLNQIMALNYYAITITFTDQTKTVLMHFIGNTLAFFLLFYCIFSWKQCGFKVHFLIILLNLVKLVIICIDFATTMVHFALLYKVFLAILLSTNVCVILAETVCMFLMVKSTSHIPQQSSVKCMKCMK